MAIVNVTGISGINSITAQSTSLNFFTAAGSTLSIGANVTGNVTGNLTGNVNATGLSTFSGGLLVGTGTSISSPATNVLTLGTNNVESVRINSSGNVGINSTAPRSKLDVGGEVIIGRQDSSQEGGQVSLCRSSDNASTWSIDAYGSTSTPSLRFVDNIAGASRMEIDGSGRVTKLYQPAFHVPKTVGDTLTTTAAKLTFSSATYDVGSNYSDANDRFTAPVAGKYFFYTSLNILSSANASLIYIRKNGSTYGQILYAATNYPRMDFNPVGIIDLAVSDYVEIFGSISSGTVTVDNAGYFGGYLLG